MKFSIQKGVFVFILMSLFLIPSLAAAQHQFEVTPAITVGGGYDDNIFLTPDDEVSDYLTTISPSLSLNTVAERYNLLLRYAPTFVFYADEDDNDTTRHLGEVSFGADVTQHLRFNFSDTFYRSEEPIELDPFVTGVRRTRETYYRNAGRTSISYLFGPENEITAGYGQTYLKNDDETIDDGRIQDPFGSLAYWFNVKNGVELYYGYTKADFWVDVGTAGDDYTGHNPGITYLHRFTPQTTGSVGYTYSTRDFDDFTEDYDVHDGLVRLEHAFSPDFSISAGAGYFFLDNDESDDDDGFVYDALLTKNFQRGVFTVGGAGGWDESYLDAERNGFLQFWSGNAGIEYRLLEPLNFYANGFYRLNEETGTDREWETYIGNVGFTLDLWRYFSVSIDYRYAERDDDIDTEDYTNNRVMVYLTASKLYRW